MHSYHTLIRDIMADGSRRPDRTGTGTQSLFGEQLRYNLANGFPLVTTKRVHVPSVVHELLWMLSRPTNVAGLHKHGVTIWDEWANDEGWLGPIYGKQWRSWFVKYDQRTDSNVYVDQIQGVLDSLRADPFGRRHVVSAWNVADLPDMALAPCHCLFQFYVRPISLRMRWALLQHRQSVNFLHLSEAELTTKLDDAGVPKFYLDCQLYQRSADVFLGVPFNIASYALFMSMVAHCTNMLPGEFVHTFGDVHLYDNHVEQAELQLSRQPYPLSTLWLNPNQRDLFKFTFEDIEIRHYTSWPPIKAPVAV